MNVVGGPSVETAAAEPVGLPAGAVEFFDSKGRRRGRLASGGIELRAARSGPSTRACADIVPASGGRPARDYCTGRRAGGST